MKSGLEIARKYASSISGSEAELLPDDYEKLLLWASMVMPAWRVSAQNYPLCRIPTYSLYACLINRGLIHDFDKEDEPLQDVCSYWQRKEAEFKPRFDQ